MKGIEESYAAFYKDYETKIGRRTGYDKRTRLKNVSSNKIDDIKLLILNKSIENLRSKIDIKDISVSGSKWVVSKASITTSSMNLPSNPSLSQLVRIQKTPNSTGRLRYFEDILLDHKDLSSSRINLKDHNLPIDYDVYK